MSAELPLEELGKIVTGKTPPKAIENAFEASGIPFLTPKDMDNRKWITSTERYLSNDGLNSVKNSLVPAGSIAVSCIGSDMGKAAMVPTDTVTNQQINTIIPDTNKCDPDYLYYCLSTMQQALKDIAGGSATPILNRGHFGKVTVTLPDLRYQQWAAKALSALDNKIQLNHSINQTLEQMAQALFKSWFVDFEPVKAKSAALEAGGSDEDALLAAMEAFSGKTTDQLVTLSAEQPERYAELRATAELFPSSMQDSELGDIPEGWEATTFGEVSTCLDKYRIPLSKAQREKKRGNIPYYGATSIMDYVDEYIFNGIYLLIGEDGSVIREDGTPFVQYVWGRAWVNNHAHVLQGANGISTEQLFLFIKNYNVAPYVTGAVQLKINQKNMKSIPFLKAEDRICDAFNRILLPIFDEIRNRDDESLALEKTRDALLPKLLSGGIEVSE